MTKLDIISSFAAKDINLCPAGIWDFKDGKKSPIDANRIDRLELDKYPDDNMFKFRIDDTPYMCIDIDGANILQVMQVFPTIGKTFMSTTTADDKFHAYVMRPTDFPLTRLIGDAMAKVDILTSGIVFEGHLYNHKDSKYDINSYEIKELTQSEIDYLFNLIKNKKVGKHVNGEALPRYNIEEANLIKTYIKQEGIVTNNERDKLYKLITPNGLIPSKKLNGLPKASYDHLNTMAFYLALNVYLEHDEMLKFMEMLMVHHYKFSLTSEMTQKNWYKSIVPTLPIVAGIQYTTEFTKYIDQAPLSTNNTYRLVSTMDWTGNLKYLQINKATLEPRTQNGVMLMSMSSLKSQYPTLDADNWMFGVPQVQITENPFAEHTSYNVMDDTFTLNTLTRTEYQINLHAVAEKPDNILTKSIAGVFMPLDEDTIAAEDFYYHWLAHVLYSSQAVTTIMALVTPSNIAGGTGKTSLTATLPMHILPKGTVTAINDSMAKWSADVFLGRMAAFDDLFASEKWKEVYTIIKQQTSNTIKILDKKGKGTVLSDRRTNISISANFIPKIDESDRRFFLWSPRERLEPEEGNKIAKIFESYYTYSQEIQDIANYCKYLYDTEPDKYYNELYIKAPNTDISSVSKSEGGLGETVISRILAGPNRLFEDYVGGKDKWTDVEIAEFLLNTVTEPNNRCKNYTIALPWHFYNEVLKSLKADEQTDYTKGRLALVMGKVHFKDLGVNRHSLYADKFPDWTRYGLLHNIEEIVIKQYKNFIEIKKNSKDFNKKLIIDGI